MNESINPSLAVRPRPFPGESPGGYLQRVARANGWDHAGQLLPLARSSQAPPFASIARLLRLSTEEIAYLFGVLPRRWCWTGFAHDLPATEFNYSFKRWCPLCLTVTPCYQGAWELKLNCVCTVHRVWLRDTCPGCRSPVPWSTPLNAQCHCGAELKTQASEPAEIRVFALGSAVTSFDAPSIFAPGIPSLKPAAVCRIVRYLGVFANDHRPTRPGKIAGLQRLPAARTLLEGANSLLADWPAAFHTLLAAVQSASLGSPTSLRDTFAPLYRVLYKELREPCFQFLRDAFESYLNEHWWGIVCKRNRLMKPETLAAHPRSTVKSASIRSAVQPSTLHHLIQQELLPAETAITAAGRQISTLHEKQIQALQTLTDGALNLNATAALLQLPAARVRQMVDIGLLQPLISKRSSASPVWVFSRGELLRLCIRPGRPALDRTISFREVLKYWHITPADMTALVTALVNGSLSTVGANLDPVPIGDALLEGPIARSFLDTVRLQRAGTMSVDQAAARLGIKQQVAYHLVRKGLLGSTNELRAGTRVSASDVADFQSKYVSLADVAAVIQHSPRAALQKVQAEPVCGASIDACRQYFYKRADVAQMLQSQRLYEDESVGSDEPTTSPPISI